MGKLEKFEIEYDHPQAVYRAGEVLRGKVVVQLREPMKMRNIQLFCQGRAKVHWTKTRRSGKSSHTVHYREEEIYFEQILPLFGSEHGESILDAGLHCFDFHIELRSDLPSSFEGAFGSVRYICKATIDKPWKFDYQSKSAFTVLSNLDLNTEATELKTAMQGEETSDVLCCCCCYRGQVRAMFRINKRGYVPGESILIYAEIHNASTTAVNYTRVTLKQYTEFYGLSGEMFSSGNRKTKSFSSYVVTKERGAIQAGETDTWSNVPLTVPSIPPSRLVGCDIISIAYVVKFYVGVNYGEEIKLVSDVIIGTIPLREAFAALYGSTDDVLTSQPTAPTAIQAADQKIRLDKEGWQIPPPSYEEHTLGKVHIMEEDDSEYTHGARHWAPSYPFYRQLSLEGQIDPQPSTSAVGHTGTRV